MADNPLVSVVIPTYNRAATIARAIDSVVRQAGVRWRS
ncbi:MAG: glycosyltransferase [Aliidongia sp.]